jgi:tetratricopeptide (TPR) repeat protein
MLDNFERDEGIQHFHRGVALERVNRIMEAIEEYRQAIASYPQLREAHAALGFYYQRNGLLAKAAEEFHTVANLEGSFLAYFNLGHVLVELERSEEALRVFEQCLRLEVDDPATHYEIAFIHYSCGEFAQALEHLHIPRQSYPEDWEVLNLMGKCYLGLRKYDEAKDSFENACSFATIPQVESELLDNIDTVERHREFVEFCSMKDTMYAKDGVIYLGSSLDDGMIVHDVEDYHFTYPDIGRTVRRLLALQQAFTWGFSAVIAVDAPAQPLAGALALLLQLPLRQVKELLPGDVPLLVMAVAREADMILVAIEHLPCTGVSFCLGVNWLRHSTVLPDFTGMVVRRVCSVPWEPELRRLRADGASQEDIQHCVQNALDQILHVVREIPSEGTLEQQVTYYLREHCRLSFYDCSSKLL